MHLSRFSIHFIHIYGRIPSHSGGTIPGSEDAIPLFLFILLVTILVLDGSFINPVMTNEIFCSDRRAEERAAYELERSAKEVRNTVQCNISMTTSGWVGRAEEGDGGEEKEARGGGGQFTRKLKIKNDICI